MGRWRLLPCLRGCGRLAACACVRCMCIRALSMLCRHRSPRAAPLPACAAGAAANAKEAASRNGAASSSASPSSSSDGSSANGAAAPATSSSKPEHEPVPWGDFMRSPPVWAVTVAHFCFNWGYYTLLAWLPSYFELALGLNVQSSSFLTLIPYVAMTMMTPVVRARLEKGGRVDRQRVWWPCPAWAARPAGRAD